MHEYYRLQNESRTDKIDANIKNWLNIFNLGEQIKVERVSNAGFNLSIIKGGKEIGLADFGNGEANLISLILQITILSHEEDEYRNRPELYLIEEPELYLHPDWQSKLADFFIESSNELDIQYIIETHSEYLIRKFQLLIAKKIIKPDKISCYYLDKNPDKKAIRIKFREDGIAENDFGPGFFDESTKLTIDLISWQSEN
ncbi:hypothetical protein ES705_40622 [subsurface metagenome]